MTGSSTSRRTGRWVVSAIAFCVAVVAACTDLPSSQLLADEVEMQVGEERVVEVLFNDYA